MTYFLILLVEYYLALLLNLKKKAYLTDSCANTIQKYFLILEEMFEVKIKFYHVLQSQIFTGYILQKILKLTANIIK